MCAGVNELPAEQIPHMFTNIKWWKYFFKQTKEESKEYLKLSG